MSKEASPHASKETSPKSSAAKVKPNGLMSKSTPDISKLIKENKRGGPKSITKINNKLRAQQDLMKLTDKVDTLVRTDSHQSFLIFITITV